ncbi:MAG: hypothetical protein ACKO7W_09060 [Elainella sp.]
MVKPNFQAVVSDPELQAAAVADTVWRGELDLAETVALHQPIKARSDALTGDYANEGVRALQAQMIGLEQTFTQFMVKAGQAKDPKQADRWMTMALRCQDQYRRSLLTIHQIKNPSRVQFIKSYVNQQLNQLNQNGEERMDAGATAAAARELPENKTLVEIDWPQDATGQGNLFEECLPGS